MTPETWAEAAIGTGSARGSYGASEVLISGVAMGEPSDS